MKLNINIHDIIGWDITSKSVKALIDQSEDVDEIDVSINSPGGSAFDGIAIYNILKNHSAKVNVFVEGWAASAASIIAMAGDTITMELGSMMMIHNASLITIGESKEHKKSSEILDKLDNNIARIYADRTGEDLKTMKSLMSDETWMDEDDAVSLGFANEKGDNDVAENIYEGLKNHYEFFNQFSNAPCFVKEILNNHPGMMTVSMKQGGNNPAKKENAMPIKSLTLDQLKNERPDLVDAVKAEIDIDSERKAAIKEDRERTEKITNEAKRYRLDPSNYIKAEGDVNSIVSKIREDALKAYEESADDTDLGPNTEPENKKPQANKASEALMAAAEKFKK